VLAMAKSAVPVACPIGRSTPGTHGHSRTTLYTALPAYMQDDPLRKPTFQAGGAVPRCTIVSAMSGASWPGRYAVASRALTRSHGLRDGSYRDYGEEQGTRWRVRRETRNRGSPTRLVHGFVHETRRDGLRRGRCRRSTRTLPYPLTEVSATARDRPGGLRRTSYGS